MLVSKRLYLIMSIRAAVRNIDASPPACVPAPVRVNRISGVFNPVVTVGARIQQPVRNLAHLQAGIQLRPRKPERPPVYGPAYPVLIFPGSGDKLSISASGKDGALTIRNINLYILGNINSVAPLGLPGKD